jgi:hypothetical protein
MEFLKGVVWEHPPAVSNGNHFHRYVFGCVLVTTKPISGIRDDGEHVIMGDATGLTEFLSNSQKMRPPHMLGDLATAVMTLADMHPNELVPV